MLTADLVRARRVDGELQLIPLSERTRARAVELGGLLLQVLHDHLGKTRDELDEAFAGLQFAPNKKRVAEGLRKLLLDRSVFDALLPADPEALRRDLFLQAAALRRAATAERPFDAGAVLAEVAGRHAMDPEAFLRALYADLRGAHILREVPALSAERLVEIYEQAQAQGVLLRAVRVEVEVICHSAAGYRHLFHKIKFLRLLSAIHPMRDGGYRIEIDGPFSLFESTTKYGLQLALLLPHLLACDEFHLRADVRWGKEREALTFRLTGEGGTGPLVAEGAAEGNDDLGHLPEEVAALCERFRALASPWKVVPSPEVLHLPGVGLCVPDLLFAHSETGAAVYLEVLGYWSREAVWRRVELVEKGLPYQILFALSERLRVSEEALSEGLPGMLYVYKGAMNARAVADKLDRLAQRKG